MSPSNFQRSLVHDQNDPSTAASDTNSDSGSDGGVLLDYDIATRSCEPSMTPGRRALEATASRATEALLLSPSLAASPKTASPTNEEDEDLIKPDSCVKVGDGRTSSPMEPKSPAAKTTVPSSGPETSGIGNKKHLEVRWGAPSPTKRFNWGHKRRSCSINQMSNWRAQPDDPKTPGPTATQVTTQTSSGIPFRGKPSASYSWTVGERDAAKRLVAALPQKKEEADEVAQDVRDYRDFHRLSQKSYFTPMASLEHRRDRCTKSDIPVEQSTAVFLRGLPAGTTYKDLLEHVRAGKIWHTHLDAPSLPSHPSVCGKIAFCTRAAAVAFMDDVGAGRYVVRGQRIFSALWDRRCEKERADRGETRCLQIKGPASVMKWSWFEREFTAKIHLKITEFFEVPSREEDKKIFQINFAGIFAQSRAVARAVKKDYSDIYSYRYVPDPCGD